MATACTREKQTLKTIEAALKLIDAKKEKLKEAYDELQLHSSILTSSAVSLSWDDLNSLFSSDQADLNRRFHLLQSRDRPPTSTISSLTITNLKQASSSRSAEIKVNEDGGFEHGPLSPDAGGSGQCPAHQVAARPELISFCEKLDGKGLIDYISDNAKQRVAIRAELGSAMQVSSDPCSMVLDAMEGFYPVSSSSKGDKDQELYRHRRSCLDLLEVLVNMKPNVSDEARERAKQLALEWKGKVSLAGDSPSEALAFLNLVAAFGLRDQFDVGELVIYFVAIAKFKQAISLCRDIDLGENISVLVQKLIESGKQLLAVKFVFEFGLSDKFQAVPLLKEFLNECKKFTNQACKNGKSAVKVQEAKSKELNALTSVLKVIDDHKLQTEYPQIEIEKRIETLRMQKTDEKLIISSSDTKPQQQQLQRQQPKKKKKQMVVKKFLQVKKPQHQQQQRNGNNRFRTSGPAPPIGAHGSSVPPFHQPHLQATGLFQTAGPYGMVSSSPPIGPYAGSYAGPYGSAGAGAGFPGNPNPPPAQQYSSESQMMSGYHDGGQDRGYYGGYGYPPHHHQSYYPQ